MHVKASALVEISFVCYCAIVPKILLILTIHRMMKISLVYRHFMIKISYHFWTFFRHQPSSQKSTTLFTNWCRRWTFIGRFVGCFEDFLLARGSIHDTHLNLPHTMGWFKQCWCTKVWCKAWRINSLWKGKSNIRWWKRTTLSKCCEKFMNNLCNLNTKLYKGEHQQQHHHHHHKTLEHENWCQKFDQNFHIECDDVVHKIIIQNWVKSTCKSKC